MSDTVTVIHSETQKEIQMPKALTEKRWFQNSPWVLKEPMGELLDPNKDGSPFLTQQSEPVKKNEADAVAEPTPVSEEEQAELNEIADATDSNDLQGFDYANVNATAKALELMEAKGIDPALITGTGKDGQITLSNVKEYINE